MYNGKSNFELLIDDSSLKKNFDYVSLKIKKQMNKFEGSFFSKLLSNIQINSKSLI